jgi:hypothetical protein
MMIFYVRIGMIRFGQILADNLNGWKPEAAAIKNRLSHKLPRGEK